jgi:hypothetical protein
MNVSCLEIELVAGGLYIFFEGKQEGSSPTILLLERKT